MEQGKKTATYKVTSDSGGYVFRFFCDSSGELDCVTRPIRADTEEAALNETQSALYFGEVTIPPTKVGTTTIPASTAIMAVFKLTPFQSTSHDVTVKYSKAADSGAGEHAIGNTVTIDAGTKEGYTFNGWTSADGVTFDDANSAETTFTMPANDVTVVANWTKNGSVVDPDPPTPPADLYTVTVETNGHGTASATPATGKEGDTITLSYNADTGYHFKEWQVVSGEVSISGNTFTMPASHVTVKAIFEADKTPVVPVEPKPNPVKPVTPVTPVTPAEPTEPETPTNPFADVPAGEYYEDAVIWAVGNGITGGMDATHFSPNATCTRAQAVTFLWRAAGSPAPKSTEMPFTDVKADSYCYNAVLWAVENGITKGTGNGTTFSPDMDCTRAQIVTFIYRCMK